MGALADPRASRRGHREPRESVGTARAERTHRGAALALAALILVVATALWTQAVDVLLWTQDEEYFVQLSRLLAENFPSAVVDLPVNPFDERGTQRLTILLLAWPLSVVTGELGIQIARFVQCLAFASAAIPAYLLARGVLLSRPWSLGVAAATIVVPWAVLTGSFLTEPVAYAAALWAVWAAWRACVVAGWRSDLLALGVVLAAGTARTNLLVLGVVAPTAILLHVWIGAAGPGRVRRFAQAMWRGHPIYTLLIVPGAIVLTLNLIGIRPGPIGTLFGSYVTSFDIADFSTLPEKWALQVSRIAIGVGLIPAMLGVPWILRQVVRRTSPREGALAIVCLVGFCVMLVSTMYAAAEERYLMLAAPLVLVPGLVAIARGQLPVWAAALGAVAIAVLVARVAWPYTENQASMLTDPVQAFWGRTVVRRAPELAGEAAMGAGLAVLALALAVVALTVLRRTRARPAVLALAAFVAVFQLVQTGYAVTKRTDFTRGPGTLADRTWVDDRVGDATVGIHAQALANSSEYVGIWRDVTLWNRRVEKLTSTEFVDLQIPRYAQAVTLQLDRRTGVLRAPAGESVPRWMLRATTFRDQGLVADRVETSGYLPVELVRLRGRPRLTWLWEGVERDGFLSTEKPSAQLTVLPPAFGTPGARCVAVTLVAPANGGTHRFTVRAGDVRRAGTLRAGAQRVVRVPVRRAGGTVTVGATGFRDLGDKRRVAVQIASTQVRACASR
jgi:hypothetical protein